MAFFSHEDDVVKTTRQAVEELRARMAFVVFGNAVVDVLQLHGVGGHTFVETVNSGTRHLLLKVLTEGNVRVEFPAPFGCL